MKLIVFSDIHGNSDVLKKMLLTESDSGECQYIFCGDIAGYYYNIKECINILQSMENLICVRGNHDQMYIEAFENKSLTERLVRKYGSSYKMKDSFVMKYLSALPLQCALEIEGKNILVQHGTPNDLLGGRIYPDVKDIADTSADIVLFGHTHYRMHKVVNHTVWINPGSLGQPRDGLGFSYCIITTKPFSVEFKRLEIDLENLRKQIKEDDICNPYLWKIFERKRGKNEKDINNSYWG